MENLVKGIFRGVLAMSLSDGELQAEERALMRTIAERFDLPEEDLAEAIGDARALDSEALRSKLDHDDRLVVAQYAVMAAYADGHVDKKEEEYLLQFEKRLGLTKEDIKGLEKLGRELSEAAKARPINLDLLNEIVESFAG